MYNNDLESTTQKVFVEKKMFQIFHFSFVFFFLFKKEICICKKSIDSYNIFFFMEYTFDLGQKLNVAEKRIHFTYQQFFSKRIVQMVFLSIENGAKIFTIALRRWTKKRMHWCN